MGYRSNIPDIYKDYSIFALTSRHEGFPMVLLEAISSGLPIISLDCETGPSELIKDGENGFLVKCFDVEEFAKKLNTLTTEINLKEFSESTMARSSDFKQEKFLSEWVNLIQSILKRD